MSERMLTLAEIAEQMRVSRETVRRWMRTHKLRGVWIGGKTGWRVPPEELQRFIREHDHRA